MPFLSQIQGSVWLPKRACLGICRVVGGFLGVQMTTWRDSKQYPKRDLPAGAGLKESSLRALITGTPNGVQMTTLRDLARFGPFWGPVWGP